MGTPLGPDSILYAYIDPLGSRFQRLKALKALVSLG